MACGALACSSSIVIATERSGAAAPARFAAWFTHIAGDLDRALARSGQRRALLDLDDRLLADIGLTRDDAWREARKPFWR